MEKPFQLLPKFHHMESVCEYIYLYVVTYVTHIHKHPHKIKTSYFLISLDGKSSQVTHP